jgi:uncharacterized protein
MDYFPLSLAFGEAFCNRTQEQADLLYNIKESRPTLISSPRRYGKTSLALHVINNSKLHYCQCDFLAAINETDVEKIILKGVGQLLGRIETGPRKLLKVATDFFSGLNIQLNLEKIGLSVQLNKASSDPVGNILSILERVDKLSEKYNKKIVFFLDEFQRIYQISDNYAIESVMRQIAQSSRNLSFIFAGSNRHLLNQIFEDKNRPFYKLCQRIPLERIEIKCYAEYIDRALKNSPGITLVQGVLEEVCKLTENHPYYFNLLFSRLWREKIITIELVQARWAAYIQEEKSQIANELDLLSGAQRKVLISLARSGGTSEPRSREFQAISQVPSATIRQALLALEKRDYVFYNISSSKYTLIDPAIKWLLADI